MAHQYYSIYCQGLIFAVASLSTADAKPFPSHIGSALQELTRLRLVVWVAAGQRGEMVRAEDK